MSSVQHALDAFDKIVEHADLDGVTVFVWLNKRDLFERMHVTQQCADLQTIEEHTRTKFV